MRQQDMREYFDYEPTLDFGDNLEPGTEIRLTGYPSQLQDLPEHMAFDQMSVNLKLVPITAFSLPDEPSDKSGWFDYVQQQFGGPRTIHSCGCLYNTGE